MPRYKRLNGESGVEGYKIEETGLQVKFEGGTVYLYNYDSSGRKHVEAMKRLALKGKGLATYINQHVRENFAAKLQ